MPRFSVIADPLDFRYDTFGGNGDHEKDNLKGGGDLDWFFAELGKDKLKDKKGFEELN